MLTIFIKVQYNIISKLWGLKRHKNKPEYIYIEEVLGSVNLSRTFNPISKGMLRFQSTINLISSDIEYKILN